MTANKNAITTRAISKRDAYEALLTDVKVGVGLSVEVEDDGVGVGVRICVEDEGAEVELRRTFAGIVTVCVGLQLLV